MSARLAPCGTYGAYQRHQRRGEECAPCREAGLLYLKQRHQKRRAENPERLRKQTREAARRQRARDPEGVRRRFRGYQLKKYGLTHESFEALLASQGHVCRCCGSDTPSSHGWCVDHDHALGLRAVRGIVCNRCNVVLGILGDSVEGVRTVSAMCLRYLGGTP